MAWSRVSLVCLSMCNNGMYNSDETSHGFTSAADSNERF